MRKLGLKLLITARALIMRLKYYRDLNLDLFVFSPGFLQFKV